MGVLGTGIAAGVAQTGQQAQQVAKKKDKKARDRQAAADAVELMSLGQDRVEADEKAVPAGGAEPIGVATDNEQGDKPTDVGIQQALTQQHRPSAAGDADADHAEVEPVSPAEAAASYQRMEDDAEEAHAVEAPSEAEPIEAKPGSPDAESASAAAEPAEDPAVSQAAPPHKHLDLEA